MKTTRQVLLVAAVSALLGACSRTQTPEPPQTTNQPAPNASTNAGEQTLKFSGTITDAAGNPLAGATVEYWSYSGPLNQLQMKEQLTTRADGAFALQVSRSTGFLLAQKPGLAPAWRQLNQQLNPAGETEQRLALTPPASLAGVVVDESNQPVANIEVFVAIAASEISLENGGRTFSYLRGNLARDCFAAHPDAAGHFRIENFPTNANAALAVRSSGKALRQSPQESISFDSLPWHAGQEDIQLIVEPAGGIEGKITVEGGAPPLPVARLALQPVGVGSFLLDEREPAQSGADGVFRISDVPAGSYRLRAAFGTNAFPDWVAETVPISVESGQIARNVQVTALRGAVLEVSVVGEGDRKPVARVSVGAYRENSQSSAVTDGKGVARLRLIPGDYQISASRQSMTSSQTSATVEAGVTNRVEMEIAAPKKITGIVRQPNGQPAAGLPVKLIGSFGPNVADIKTDAGGRFELEWNQRQAGQMDATPCILVRDAEHNLAVAQDIEEDTGPLDLKLAPGLTLAGRAECDGKPVTNAAAALVFWTGRSGMWLQGLARTNTPTPGQFEIPALPPGRKYGVIVSAPGYGQKQLFNFDVSADAGRQALDPVELKLANLKLSGQVLDADDNPVSGAVVRSNGEGQPNVSVRTDRQGRFTFEHVCEGALQISASYQSSHGSTSAEGGDMNVVLRLGQTYGSSSGSTMRKLKGTVTDADGKPAAGAQVAVFPNNGTRWVKTGQNGEYNLTWSLQSWQSPNGGLQLVCLDRARNLAGTAELSEDDTNLNVKLKPALAFSGQVNNADGAPLPSAKITFWIKSGNSYDFLDQETAIPVNTEGRFEIKCLPADGQYMIAASASGFGRQQQRISPDSETNRVELETFVLHRADRVIAGQVLKDDDKPASGVSVQLNGNDQPDGSVTTDSKGRFHFQVCEGQVRLYAYSQNGSGSAQATVDAGDTNIVLNLGSSSGGSRQTPPRASLKGNPLPDLTTVNLTADTAPAGKPVLLCLFDAGQRPSRHVINQLEQQAAALRQQNVSVLGVQAAVASDDVFNEWKSASPVSFPVGRVTEKSEKSKWAAAVPALPWLILTDADHRVVAEGFAFDDLDAQIKKLAK
jgi:protocatechuate 3,4-dioxygenase beta subunit